MCGSVHAYTTRGSWAPATPRRKHETLLCRVLRSDVHRSEGDVELLQRPPDETAQPPTHAAPRMSSME
eukprot:3097653-Prymnesium_polylepis.1